MTLDLDGVVQVGLGYEIETEIRLLGHSHEVYEGCTGHLAARTVYSVLAGLDYLASGVEYLVQSLFA